MNQLSISNGEKTRKRIAKLQSEILQAIAKKTQTKIADELNVSISTVSRWVSDDLTRVCEILAILGLKVAPVSSVVTTKQELNGLKRMALRYLEADLEGQDE